MLKKKFAPPLKAFHSVAPPPPQLQQQGLKRNIEIVSDFPGISKVEKGGPVTFNKQMPNSDIHKKIRLIEESSTYPQINAQYSDGVVPDFFELDENYQNLEKKTECVEQRVPLTGFFLSYS